MPAPRFSQLERIVSGGQTGVDRAALDVAIELGIPCGGWCPRGRRAEDGVIPAYYPLAETASVHYRVRTRENVADSDGTLILSFGPPEVGTRHTATFAGRFARPLHIVDLNGKADVEAVRRWLVISGIRTLNVAGPRESARERFGASPYQTARALLLALFDE